MKCDTKCKGQPLFVIILFYDFFYKKNLYIHLYDMVVNSAIELKADPICILFIKMLFVINGILDGKATAGQNSRKVAIP